MSANPYGLMNLWAQGDIVTKMVALLLLTMSILSWYVIVYKGLRLRRLHQYAKVAGGEFWHSKSLEDGLELFGPDSEGNPFYHLAQDGVQAAAHHAHSKDDLHGALTLNDWLNSCLRLSIENITHRLQAGLSILASIGSTAPFVGLFGTVWGIYHALVSISVSGQVGIEKVAGPVGESLIMTALGLAVAIPAVLGYNTLTRSNKKILSRVRNFAHDIQVCLLTGERVNTNASLVGAGR